MAYRVDIRPAARRQIKKLSRETQAAILTRLAGLAENPRPEGVEALEGHPNFLRIRSGQYRIIYSVEDFYLVVLVIRVGHRREVYRKLPSK